MQQHFVRKRHENKKKKKKTKTKTKTTEYITSPGMIKSVTQARYSGKVPRE